MTSNRTINTVLAVVGVVLSLLPQLVDVAVALNVPWASTAVTILGVVLTLAARLEVILGLDLNHDGRVGPAPPRASSPWPVVLVAVVVALLVSACGGGQSLPVTFGEVRITGDVHVTGEAVCTVDGCVGDFIAAGDGELSASVEALGIPGTVALITVGDATTDGAGGLVKWCYVLGAGDRVCRELASGSTSDPPDE